MRSLHMLCILRRTGTSTILPLLTCKSRDQTSIYSLLRRLSFSCPPLCSWLTRVVLTRRGDMQGLSRHMLLASKQRAGGAVALCVTRRGCLSSCHGRVKAGACGKAAGFSQC